MNQILKLGIILMIFAGTSGALLALVNKGTLPYIEKQKAELDSLSSVFPTASKFEKKEGSQAYYEAYTTEGTLAGFVLVLNAKGYAGNIAGLVGIDKAGIIQGVKFLDNKETPGLGANIVESWFTNQFKGKSATDLEITKQKDDKKIIALTGATISSKAVTDEIKSKAIEFLKNIK